MAAQHTIPDLTFSTHIYAQELWQCFWNLTAFWNSYISFNSATTLSANFGTGPSNLSTSYNLKPHKVRFGYGGHDHSGLWDHGAYLSPSAVSKVSFDLNATNLLWYDLFGSGYINKYFNLTNKTTMVILPGKVAAISGMNPLSTQPNLGGTYAGLLIDGVADSAWVNYTLYGFIICPNTPSTPDPGPSTEHYQFVYFDGSKYQVKSSGHGAGTGLSYLYIGMVNHA